MLRNFKIGRLYCGTRQPTVCDPAYPAECSLYCYDRIHGVQQLVTEVRVSSGTAWNPEEECFYHVRGCQRLIRGYKWCPKSGRLCELRICRSVNSFMSLEISYIKH